MTAPATPSERAVTTPMTAPVMPPNAAENEPRPKATDGVRREATSRRWTDQGESADFANATAC